MQSIDEKFKEAMKKEREDVFFHLQKKLCRNLILQIVKNMKLNTF